MFAAPDKVALLAPAGNYPIHGTCLGLEVLSEILAGMDDTVCGHFDGQDYVQKARDWRFVSMPDSVHAVHETRKWLRHWDAPSQLASASFLLGHVMAAPPLMARHCPSRS